MLKHLSNTHNMHTKLMRPGNQSLGYVRTEISRYTYK